MYIFATKATRILFWSALVAGILSLLMPEQVPFAIAIALAIGCVSFFTYAALHIQRTRRYGLACPACGWIPFALNAWKCKECGQVWDSFATNGVCPQCGHVHEETACVRCRKIAKNSQWART